MAKTGKQDLSQYVERVMKEKRLSRRDVKLRSGGDITDSYVSGVVSGSAKNLSVDKLKALARGLRVPDMELIRVAFGLSDDRESHQGSDQSHNLVLIDLTRKAVISSDVAEIVQEVIGLSPSDRTIVLQYVKRLGRAERRAQRRRRSV